MKPSKLLNIANVGVRYCKDCDDPFRSRSISDHRCEKCREKKFKQWKRFVNARRGY